MIDSRKGNLHLLRCWRHRKDFLHRNKKQQEFRMHLPSVHPHCVLVRKSNLPTYHVNVTFQWRPVEHQQGLQEGEHGGRRVLPAAHQESNLHASGAGGGTQGRVDGGPEPERERDRHTGWTLQQGKLSRKHVYRQYHNVCGGSGKMRETKPKQRKRWCIHHCTVRFTLEDNQSCNVSGHQ